MRRPTPLPAGPSRSGSARLLVLAVLAGAGCGDGSPEPANGDRAAGPGSGVPWKTKLADVPGGVLLPPAEVEPPVTLLAEDFADGLEGWTLASDAATGQHHDPALLAAEPGPGGLRLAGTRGFAWRLVEVEPSTCYRFRARVRSDGLEGGDDFHGGVPWLAELSVFGPPEVLPEGPEPHVVQVADPLAEGGERGARYLFETASGTRGVRTLEQLVTTTPETRSLLVALVLSFDVAPTGGAVVFEEVTLERLPLREQWLADVAVAQEDYGRGLPPLEGWRAERLVRGSIGAEVRPSILLLPGERLGLRLRVPRGAPALETGLGFWTPSLLPGTAREHRFLVRVDGAQVLAEPATAPDDPAAGRWNDRRIDLAAHAGREITLELAVEGDLPGLFGAPVLRDASHEPASGEHNVLLISIDTLRADQLGCYGAPGNPTPNLDRLAAEGVRFADVDGQAPYTLPGHATLFTGQFPSVHGVQYTKNVLSTERSPVLARILSDLGYRTQAFTGGGFVNADFGFDRGFDSFANVDPIRQRDAVFFRQILENDLNAIRRLRRNARIPDRVTRELIDEYGPERLTEWLEEAVRESREPFLLFVHTYMVHDYDPPQAYVTCHEELGCSSTKRTYDEYRLSRRTGWNPQPISAEDAEHLLHLYVATLRFTDERVGRLLADLDRLGLRDSTVVAVVTDHGEELLERGFMQHGKTLYEEITDLPMILRVPGVAPRVVEAPVMQIDLAPTVLGALGIPPDPRMQGQDVLAPALDVRRTWSEIHDDFVHKYALRDGSWKLHHAPPDPAVDFEAPWEWQLFDLATDPGERVDLSAEEPERFERLRAKLLETREVLRSVGEGLGALEEGAIDPRTQQQLEDLGYAGGR